MKRRDRFVLVLMTWACVYPGVTMFSYVFTWAGIQWPLWIQLAISTAFTVPTISLLVLPQIQKLIAKARRETLADLHLEEARRAPGPNPEDTARSA